MGKTFSYSVKYSYDAANRLIWAGADDSWNYRYAYDAAGNLFKADYSDSAETVAGPPPPAQTMGASPPHQALPAPDQPHAWFMSRQGQQYGPYTWEQLWQFAREGRLLAGDLVWHPSLPQWTRAESMNELKL